LPLFVSFNFFERERESMGCERERKNFEIWERERTLGDERERTNV